MAAEIQQYRSFTDGQQPKSVHWQKKKKKKKEGRKEERKKERKEGRNKQINKEQINQREIPIQKIIH